jgi:hypothetical protein
MDELPWSHAAFPPLETSVYYTCYVTGHAWQTVTFNALMPSFINIVLFARKPLRMIHTHVHV